MKKKYVVMFTLVEDDGAVDSTYPPVYTHANSEKQALSFVSYRMKMKRPKAKLRDVKIEEVVDQQDDAPVTNHKEEKDMTINTERLEGMTVEELKDICRDKELRGYSKLNKAALVQFVKDSLIRESITVSVDGVPVNKEKEEEEVKLSNHGKLIQMMEEAKDTRRLSDDEVKALERYELPKDLQKKLKIISTYGEKLIAGSKNSQGMTIYHIQENIVTRVSGIKSNGGRKVLWTSRNLYDWRKIVLGKTEVFLKMLVLNKKIFGAIESNGKSYNFIWDKDKYNKPYLCNRMKADKADKYRKAIVKLVGLYKEQMLEQRKYEKGEVDKKEVKKSANKTMKGVKVTRKPKEVKDKEIKDVFK
jgi:hypothetical protein